MSGSVLLSRLPDEAVAFPLPGTRPVDPDDWLRVDGAYAAQMALRDALLEERPHLVRDVLPEGRAAAREALALVVDHLSRRSDFEVTQDTVRRPDGRRVSLNDDNPLGTIGRLVQEDLCLLAQSPEGHHLVGAVLCFPSAWTLAQKMGRTLDALHGPVPAYGGDVARRVQRLFDGVRSGRPLVRHNLLHHDSDALFNPRLEFSQTPRGPGDSRFRRVERQVILRLPETGLVGFSIHTYLVAAAGG